ncbi:Ppx/GppA phosphatase family protein [Noviherbaspirillum sp.]|uniref:Ppx/GppA phosphatase family protein n=1 Tax=Noviherbaspirillum sp. TaxID=1926288 RepID=UPI002D682BBB|nr:Ppx/GppA phosphatase family protein [Noviherbaspirillum sp.]HZW23778.1 Ppx/GppA phosphatase family protein [Noviherbaspirillum sp.]
MFAAVDLGSNSFRLHIGKLEGGAFRIVKTARDPIRLGAGLDSEGNLTEQARQAALNCLKNFRTILEGYPLDAVRVVATNTLRIARNAADFLPEAEQAIAYPIEIISGEEEGRLIYMGVASTLALPNEARLVIDIGGGSTELILGQGQEIRHVESFSIGTVQQSQAFFPGGAIDAAAFADAIMSARSLFEDAAPLYDRRHWTGAYGSSGTIRAISDAIAKNGIGDGTMSIGSLDALKDHLIACGHVDRVQLAGIKPERVIVMAGGLAILIGIMQELRVAAMTAVDAGLRMGVLWDLQLRASKLDRRELSVQEFMRRFHAPESRALQVARTARALYDQLKPASNGLGQYLYWSGMLHEVGVAISHTGYHKHGAYVIENADLPGFTAREQRVMSTLVLAQKGNLRKLGDTLSDPDFAKAVLALRLAAIFLHSRIDEDVRGMRLKMKNRIEIELKPDWLENHPTLSYWVEKERGWWGEVGTEMNVTS